MQACLEAHWIIVNVQSATFPAGIQSVLSSSCFDRRIVDQLGNDISDNFMWRRFPISHIFNIRYLDKRSLN